MDPIADAAAGSLDAIVIGDVLEGNWEEIDVGTVGQGPIGVAAHSRVGVVGEEEQLWGRGFVVQGNVVGPVFGLQVKTSYKLTGDFIGKGELVGGTADGETRASAEHRVWAIVQ